MCRQSSARAGYASQICWLGCAEKKLVRITLAKKYNWDPARDLDLGVA
jgi:hypothetical protein